MGRNSLGRAARKKGRHTSDDMKKGIRLCLNGVSIRKAAKDCNLPYPTLRRYMLKYKEDPSIRLEPNYEVNKIFTTEQENSIKEYILDCADKFYGLTTKDCRRIAYQMAHINKIQIPNTWKTLEMAGRDWMRGFRKRHPELSVKKPEACSIARATAFNRVNVQKFFDNLKEVMSRHSSFGNGSRLYNLDETSTTTVQRPQKVLAAKGRGVCKVTSGERGVLVTTCCIVNAIGQALPPAMVFPRKIFKSHMLNGAPPGTLGLASPSGWMNSELFVDVMKHFIQYSSGSKDNPALLIMDNHESHLSIPALDLAKASGVTILTLHPHTTAKLQPLDVGLHAPFKVYYNSAVDSWLLRNPGKSLTIYNVAECVGVAYMKAMTPTNITHAFKKCGIFPFEDQVFSEIDFLPSAVSERPAPDNPNGDNVDSDATAIEETTMSPPNSPSILNTCVEDEPMESASKNSEKPVTSYHSLRITAKDSLSEHSFDRPCNLPAPEVASLAIAQPNISAVNGAGNMMTKEASPPCTSNFISPKIFRPPLKAKPRTSTRIKRKAGRSIIATDTPEKNALEEVKLNKRNKKRVKSVKVDLFKQKRKKIKSDSSSEEDEEFKCSGSSSGGDDFVNESDDAEIILDDRFPPLARNPRPNDYVIIIFKSKKTDVYYIAKVLEELGIEEDCDYFVSFLKLKSKTYQRFVDPVEPDTAGVLRKDVKYILPSPKTKGTSRRQTTYTFSVNMSQLNLRY